MYANLSAKRLPCCDPSHQAPEKGNIRETAPDVKSQLRVPKTLQILQAEESVRYRTNVGIAEVTGKPATVEIAVFLPDSKVVPRVTLQLGANESRQLDVLGGLGIGAAYNARLAVRVTDGDGRVTAYGSVVDQTTQAPTFIPAQ